MYKQLVEMIERVDTLSSELNAAKKQFKFDLKIQEIHLREEFAEERKALNARIEVLEIENAALKEERQLLLDDNARMKSILNNNSSNTSLPPSTDQKGKRANTYNNRKKTGKSKGGQKGHSGKTLTRKDVEEKIKSGQFKHEIEDIGNPVTPYTSKYVIDLKITPVIRELRFHKGEKIPAKYRSDVTYGECIKAIAVDLYSEGVVSNDRICTFINAISGDTIDLSEGSVYNFCKSFSELVEGSIQKIESELLNSDVLYTDSTAVSVDGKQAYVRNQSIESAVLYSSMEKKNIENIGKSGILNRYTGILVHDHETALYHYGTGHAECNIHALRYLKKNTEEAKNKWSGEMSSLLCNINREKKEAIEQGITFFTEKQLTEYESQYDEILKKGRNENAQLKNGYAHDEEAALLNRMSKYKENHLLFAHDFRVDFTNNMSERDLRKCKNRQKMSGGFRDESGSRMYCRILSVIETCKRKGMQVLNNIEKIFKEASPIF